MIEQPALTRENLTIEQWVESHYGELVGSFSLKVYLKDPPQGLYLVRLRGD